MRRREFLRMGGAAVWAGLAAGPAFLVVGCDFTPYGPLGDPDENGIRLPDGFRSRLLARQGDPIGAGGYPWHRAPDGGAVFRDGPGWIYVSNSESGSAGGVGALRFDADGEVVDAYAICTGTRRNCAGGATPWGTWLSCEEVADGLVYECDPRGERPAVARPALGSFNHEAVAVDPKKKHLYLTEDRAFGAFYRFTPHRWRELDAGVLEVAVVDADGFVTWLPVPNPNPGPGETPTRAQVPDRAIFRGGEGAVYDHHHVYFTTKFDNRVWDYDVEAERVRVVYEAALDPERQLTGVDNVATTRDGQILVAEDGGNMELVLLDRRGLALPLLRVEGQQRSELTGPAFSPDGDRLYFSSQRGRDGRGLTYEVQGPFARGRARGLA